MKKILNVGLVLVFCISLLTGCGQEKVIEENTVIINRKGEITGVDVEALDKAYYDETELQEYITEHITDYVMEYGDGVVAQEAFVVENGIAKLTINYASDEEYSRFNETELFVGTVIEAQAEGYDFAVDFSQVAKENETMVKTAATAADVLADDGYKVAIIKANVAVEVSGKILYVSTENTEILDKKTVRITGDENGGTALTYIVYK